MTTNSVQVNKCTSVQAHKWISAFKHLLTFILAHLHTHSFEDLFFKLISKPPFLLMESIARAVKLEVEGRERLPAGGFVLCANHRGELDPYFIRRALKDHLWRQMKNQFIYSLTASKFVKRIFLAHWGGQIVCPDKINLKALRGALDALAAGNSVTIFPEGFEPGRGRPYPGAAWLACQAHKPLVPLMIEGPYAFIKRGTPFYLFPFFTLLKYLKQSRRVRLVFKEPIFPDQASYREGGRGYIEELSARLGRELGILNGG